MLADGAAARRDTGQMRPLPILSRILAAVFGGYALSAVAAVFISYLLPLQRADALMTGILFSFAIHTGAAIWVFAARTSLIAWLGLLIPGAAMAAICWLFAIGITP
jgi:Protein of unknown function (DUF3649)